MIETLMKVQ